MKGFVMTINLNEKLTGIVRTISASVRLDTDMPKTQAKSIFLDIDFSECTLGDILDFACADRRIAWANGGNGRKAYPSLKIGQHVKVLAKSAGAKTVDIFAYVNEQARAAGITPKEWLDAEAKRRGLEPLGK